MIYSLKELGVKKIISWSGPGAIKADYSIGDYVIPDDVIDETRQRESTFFRGKGIGFIRQYPTFCPALREVLKKSLESLSIQFYHEGVYVCTEGPRLETAAEINKFNEQVAILEPEVQKIAQQLEKASSSDKTENTAE